MGMNRYRDKKLWRTHGPDAVMYVLFIRLCLVFTFILMLIGNVISIATANKVGSHVAAHHTGCAVMIPIHVSGDSGATISAMGRLTISHLSSEDSRIIAHSTFSSLSHTHD